MKNTTKRRSKSISKAIMSMLLILGFVPIVIMAINSYIINIDTLRERNDIAKQGAVATIQKARTDLSKTTNDKLTEVSRQPIFENDFDLDEVKNILKNAPGVGLYDNPPNNIYPLATVANGTDDVYVGRIRRDFSQPNTLNLWCVADNIRKGAAANAIQIMEKIIEKNI